MTLPLWLAALILFYVAIGIEVAQRAFRPSCRVCLHRHVCPGRRAKLYCYSNKFEASADWKTRDAFEL